MQAARLTFAARLVPTGHFEFPPSLSMRQIFGKNSQKIFSSCLGHAGELRSKEVAATKYLLLRGTHGPHVNGLRLLRYFSLIGMRNGDQEA